MRVPYSCIIHSNLFASGTLDVGRRILELHLTRQLSVHVDFDIPHRKDVHLARNKVSQTDRTNFLRQNASVRHVCKYHCLRQVHILAHDGIRKRGNNDKHKLHFIFCGWDVLFMQYDKTKINHVLTDNANYTHQDSHYANCPIGIL
jgi:hypothetical protein